MLENKFQANLIKELKERFPGCIVMKNDPTYLENDVRIGNMLYISGQSPGCINRNILVAKFLR